MSRTERQNVDRIIEEIKPLLDREVRSLFDYVNSDRNPYNKEKYSRKLVWEIEADADPIPRAKYGVFEDRIIITSGLIEQLYDVFSLPPVNGHDEVSTNKEGNIYFALCFVLSHEFFHLHSGHLQVFGEKLYSKDLPDIVWRTIEMQADSFAATQMTNVLCLSYQNYIYDALLGIQGLFHIIRSLEYNEKRDDYDKKGSAESKLLQNHPPAIMRNYNVYTIIDGYAKEQYGVDIKLKNYMKEKFFYYDMAFQLSDDDAKKSDLCNW